MPLQEKTQLTEHFATFLSDNQKTLVLSEPIIEQSKLAKLATPSAHRSAAQEEFSLDLVEYILEQDRTGLVIHGGDAINNSCVDEFKAFIQTMGKKDKEWYLAPGNHDGFYLGISSPISWNNRKMTLNGFLDERIGWANACTPIVKTSKVKGKDRNKYLLDKFSFVQMYVREKGLKDICAQDPSSCKVDYKYGTQQSIYCIEDSSLLSGKALSKACWTSKSNKLYLDHNDFAKDTFGNDTDTLVVNNAWESFVVQLVSVTIANDVKNILLVDTAAYSKYNNAVKETGELQNNNRYGAADNAQLVLAQRNIIDRWKDDLESRGQSIDLIVGHHPMEDLEPESLNYLARLSNQTSSQIYMSGDTHDGFDVWYLNRKGERLLRQVNMGSTIDSPLEYAHLGLSRTKDIEAQRLSITPLGVDKERKSSDLYDLKKNYATTDGLWEMCKGFSYQADNVIASSLRVKQSDAYFGLPNILPGYETRSNYYAYKINRLIETVNLYRSMYSYSEASLPRELFYNSQGEQRDINLEKRAIRSLETINSQWFNGLLDEGNIRQTFVDLSRVVDVYQSDSLNSSKATKFKLCNFVTKSHSS
ncbi:metallophosphoesterase [Vibrio europaeus]|uniref:metallophosphoesterase n=1 Tax=Vibrio europaeus TaxID=300876 RepID=UPI00148E0857|nr:metallophosphoesterase [Vibrio europaeus]